MVSAFVAHHPQTNFSVGEYEGALFVGAQHRGKQGLYLVKARPAGRTRSGVALTPGRCVIQFSAQDRNRPTVSTTYPNPIAKHDPEQHKGFRRGSAGHM